MRTATSSTLNAIESLVPHALALAMSALLALCASACAPTRCVDDDCAQVVYRWPCAECGRPLLLGVGASASFFVDWRRSFHGPGGSFCPEAPRAVSSDGQVIEGAFVGDCGSMLRLTGVGPGDAHLDLFDGERLLGRWDMGVAPIHHLAIVPSEAGPLARQDPPSLDARVGVSLELVAYAYDAQGHSLFADLDHAVWQSDTPAVLALDHAGAGIFSPVAAGEARVTIELAGTSASALVVTEF